MSIIQQDKFGIFIVAGGYKCRPVNATRFNIGDKLITKHFGGSIRAGVGKSADAPRGIYQEYWCTCGNYPNEDDPKSDKEVRKLITWYKNQFQSLYPEL